MDAKDRQLIRGYITSLESTLWKIPNPVTEYQALLAACDDPNVPVYQLEQRRKRLADMAGFCQKPVDAWPKTEQDYLLPFGLPDFVPKVMRRYPWTRRERPVFILHMTTSISYYGDQTISECYTDGKCISSSNSGDVTRYQAVEHLGVSQYDAYEAFFEQFGRAQLELQFLPAALRKIIEMYLWTLEKQEFTRHYERSRGN
jgi:hypothetical protein